MLPPSVGKNDSSRGNPVLAEHYEIRLVEYLEACARHRFGRDPDPFLLQARRTLEAAVYAVWSAMIGTPPAKPLDDLLKELVSRGLLTPPRLHDFGGIRARTNRAAHVPKPEDARSADVERVARELGGVADWAAERGLCVREDLASRVRESRAHIRGEPQLLAPDVELDRLRDQARAAREREAHALAEVRDLRAKLGSLDAPAAPAGRSSTRSYVIVACVASIAFAVGAGSGWFLSRADVPLSPPVHAITNDVPRVNQESVLPAASVDAGVVIEPVVERDSGVAPVESCPEGMALIQAGEVRLRPPHDRSWVRAGLRPMTTPVPSFCLATGMVTAGEYRECVGAGSCELEPGCRTPRGARVAATCIAPAEAVDYCRWRFGPTAGLPSVAQLELVARGAHGADLIARAPREGALQRFEWAADPCLSPAFGVGSQRPSSRVLASMGLLDDPAPEPRPRISWHCPERAVGTALHRFRCVVPPSAGGADVTR